MRANMQTLSATVPLGHAPGTPMIVAVPSGESVTVTPPAHVFPGQSFQFQWQGAPIPVAAQWAPMGTAIPEVTGAPIPVTAHAMPTVSASFQVEAPVSSEEKELRASLWCALCGLLGLSVLVAPAPMGLSGLIAASLVICCSSSLSASRGCSIFSATCSAMGAVVCLALGAVLIASGGSIEECYEEMAKEDVRDDTTCSNIGWPAPHVIEKRSGFLTCACNGAAEWGAAWNGTSCRSSCEVCEPYRATCFQDDEEAAIPTPPPPPPRPPPPNDGEDDWEDRDVKRDDEDDDDDDTPERRFRNAHRACSMAHAIDCSDSGDCDGCCYSALAESSTCPWAKPADGYLGVNERDVWQGCSCDETRYCKCMSKILGAPCSLLPKQCTAAGADAGCESYLTCTYGAAGPTDEYTWGGAYPWTADQMEDDGDSCRFHKVVARPIDATEGPDGSYNCRYMTYLGSRAVSLKAIGGILFVPFVYMVAMAALASLAASRAAKLMKALRSTRATAV